jgi:hypothetical protein
MYRGSMQIRQSLTITRCHLCFPLVRLEWSDQDDLGARRIGAWLFRRLELGSDRARHASCSAAVFTSEVEAVQLASRFSASCEGEFGSAMYT